MIRKMYATQLFFVLIIMNKKINLNITLDKGTFVFLYQKYKDHLFSIGILIVCILLFIFLIVPQVNDFYAAHNEEDAYQQRIQVLQSNIRFIKSINEAELDAQLSTVSTALPIEKDFVGIISAISSAAQKTRVLVGDFTFSLGELSTASAQTDPSIKIDLKVNGTGSTAGADIRNFVKKLTEELPLSNVNTINLTNTSGTLVTAFYYRPATSVKFDAYTPLTPLSANDLALIKKLETWKKNGGSLFDLFPPQITPSVVPTTSSPVPTGTPIPTPSPTSVVVSITP